MNNVKSNIYQASKIRKILGLCKHYVLETVDRISTIFKVSEQCNTLLIIKLDAIGDYILFRNLLPFIRNCEKYKDYKITLCGNIIWKDLATRFDSDMLDEFIWVDTNKFYNKLLYRFRILKTIHARAFETVIQATATSNYYICDAVAKSTNASLKTCNRSSGYSKSIGRKLNSEKYYTQILDSNNSKFEFYKNIFYIEQFTESSISINKPSIEFHNYISKFNFDEYIVVFPGAGNSTRMWPEDNFAKVIDHIADKYKLKIIIAGASGDKTKAQKIINLSNTNSIIDLSGKTSLPDLAQLISKAKILVSNETSAVHISIAVGTPVVCISNGNHFGRFHPYPNYVQNAFYVYADELDNAISSNNEDILKELYNGEIYFDIKSVHSNAVINYIDTSFDTGIRK